MSDPDAAPETAPDDDTIPVPRLGRRLAILADCAVVAALAVDVLSLRPLQNTTIGVAVTAATLLTLLLRRRSPLLATVGCCAAISLLAAIGEPGSTLALPIIVVAYSVACFGHTTPRRTIGACIIGGTNLVVTVLAREYTDLREFTLTAVTDMAWPAAAFIAGLEIGRLRCRLADAVETSALHRTHQHHGVEAERDRVKRVLDSVIDWMQDNFTVQANLAETLLRSHDMREVSRMAVAALNAASLTGDALAEVERLHRTLQRSCDPDQALPGEGPMTMDVSGHR